MKSDLRDWAKGEGYEVDPPNQQTQKELEYHPTTPPQPKIGDYVYLENEGGFSVYTDAGWKFLSNLPVGKIEMGNVIFCTELNPFNVLDAKAIFRKLYNKDAKYLILDRGLYSQFADIKSWGDLANTFIAKGYVKEIAGLIVIWSSALHTPYHTKLESGHSYCAYLLSSVDSLKPCLNITEDILAKEEFVKITCATSAGYLIL